MAYAMILIKKSKNVLAWQNNYVGLKVRAEITDEGYSVNFKDNPNLKNIPKNWLVGKLDN